MGCWKEVSEPPASRAGKRPSLLRNDAQSPCCTCLATAEFDPSEADVERILWSRHAADGSGEEYRCKFKGALRG